MANRYPRPPVKGPVVIPNCVQVVVKWLFAGQEMSNVYHGQYSGAALTQTVADQIFNALVAAGSTTAWLAKLHTSCALVACEVKDMRQANLPTWLSAGPASHPGTSAGGETSAATALVVSLRTAKAGKGFFGRTYLPGITADNLLDARHWDTAKLEAPSIAYVNGVKTAMGGAGFQMAVAQRALSANTDPAAPPSQQVARPANCDNLVLQVVWTDSRVDTQRTRLGR